MKRLRKTNHRWDVSDKRYGPRSPEHNAAISRGMKRNAWNRKQRDLARENKPHAFEPSHYADVPGCHHCNFWGVGGEHTEETNPYA